MLFLILAVDQNICLQLNMPLTEHEVNRGVLISAQLQKYKDWFLLFVSQVTNKAFNNSLGLFALCFLVSKSLPNKYSGTLDAVSEYWVTKEMI